MGIDLYASITNREEGTYSAAASCMQAFGRSHLDLTAVRRITVNDISSVDHEEKFLMGRGLSLFLNGF